MIYFYSSGGCGDALIVGLKFSQLIKSNQKLNSLDVTWLNFEKHKKHQLPIQWIMNGFEIPGVSIIRDEPYKEAIRLAKVYEVYPAKDQYNQLGGYISSIISNMENPFLEKLIISSKNYNLGPNISIIRNSGRSNDNSTRTISHEFIIKMRQKLDNIGVKLPIIILGTKPSEIVEWSPNIIDLSGKTETILDAFEIINNSILTIGFDGVLAYYSAMVRQPTIIHFHEPNLVNHYWNERWGERGHAIIHYNKKLLDKQDADMDFAIYEDKILKKS